MKKEKNDTQPNPAFELNTSTFLPSPDRLHVYRKNVICITDTKGYPQPQNSNMREIVVDSSGGFIPLWENKMTLNWRFNKDFGSYFKDPATAKTEFKKLLGEAIMAWDAACPVRFSEDEDEWDFEISMTKDNCDTRGCVLASAFFPQQGRDNLMIYPKMFSQTREEQIETLVHELGHVFGLRHFFANISEKQWSSEIFGEHKSFSIMNYGDDSRLTKDDINDLARLYDLVWKGKLTSINRTPIVKFRPYHMSL